MLRYVPCTMPGCIAMPGCMYIVAKQGVVFDEHGVGRRRRVCGRFWRLGLKTVFCCNASRRLHVTRRRLLRGLPLRAPLFGMVFMGLYTVAPCTLSPPFTRPSCRARREAAAFVAKDAKDADAATAARAPAPGPTRCVRAPRRRALARVPLRPVLTTIAGSSSSTSPRAIP